MERERGRGREGMELAPSFWRQNLTLGCEISTHLAQIFKDLIMAVKAVKHKGYYIEEKKVKIWGKWKYKEKKEIHS